MQLFIYIYIIIEMLFLLSLSYSVYFVSRLDMFFVRNKGNALKL